MNTTFLLLAAAIAAEPDYTPADPGLVARRLDTHPTESFLAVRCDAAGRLFVGGRAALFVYEPTPTGYGPRQTLVTFPDHTWVYDIEVRGRDLYVLTTTALYLLPDGAVKRDGLKLQRLVWGVPLGHVHQCFHGLTWGPEGDLYLSMGDPLWYYGDFNRPDHWGHWTFHTQPEGTKVPYTGVGAVFRVKPDGSDFRVFARGLRNSCGLAFDQRWNLFTNDNDHESIPAEYVPGRLLHVTPGADFVWPRGWLPEKQPHRADILPSITANLGRFVPVGQAYYADTLLPAAYRDNLLVARWCTRQVTRYPLKPKGASWTAEEKPFLNGRELARPVGVCVGRGGRVFVTIAYMANNEGSPVYKSDLVVVTTKDDPPGMPFDGYEASTATAERLDQELRSPDWSRRYLAHVESLRRGGAGLGNKPKPEAAPRFETMAEAATSDDPYVRLRATGWLAEHAPLDRLARLCADDAARTRLAGVLAVGQRLTVPPAVGPIPASLPLAEWRNPKEAHVIAYADATIDLRSTGDRIGTFTTAEHWKAGPHTAEQERLFALLVARLDDADEGVRLQAAHFLRLLNDPRSEPKVAKVRRAGDEKRLATAAIKPADAVWIAGPFTDGDGGFQTLHPPETGAVDLAEVYPRKRAWTTLKQNGRLFDLSGAVGPCDGASVYAFTRIESPTRQPAQLLVGSDEGVKVWHNGKEVWANDVSRAALPFQDPVLLDLQPGSNDILIRVRNLTGTCALYLHVRAREGVAFRLPEKSTISLAERLKSGNQPLDPAFLTIDWPTEAAKGDAVKGKALFGTLGCAKCHAVAADQQVIGGPSLAEARKRFTVPHLVESVLLPGKQISPVFKATKVVTAQGKVLTGLLLGETGEKLDLLLPDTTRVEIRKADVEERATVDQSPMPAGLVKTPAELRDLLAYLLGL